MKYIFSYLYYYPIKAPLFLPTDKPQRSFNYHFQTFACSSLSHNCFLQLPSASVFSLSSSAVHHKHRTKQVLDYFSRETYYQLSYSMLWCSLANSLSSPSSSSSSSSLSYIISFFPSSSLFKSTSSYSFHPIFCSFLTLRAKLWSLIGFSSSEAEFLHHSLHSSYSVFSLPPTPNHSSIYLFVSLRSLRAVLYMILLCSNWFPSLYSSFLPSLGSLTIVKCSHSTRELLLSILNL